MKSFIVFLVLLASSYQVSEACHRYICIETCVDTVIVCRQDFNKELDPVQCKEYSKSDTSRPQCRVEKDIFLEQECPQYEECETCEECPQCPSCDSCCETYQECPICPWYPCDSCCPLCEECPPCDSCCQSCPECPKQEECQVCEKCETCKECQECPLFPEPICQDCVCEECKCEDPEECEECVKCDYKVQPNKVENTESDEKALAGGCSTSGTFGGSKAISAGLKIIVGLLFMLIGIRGLKKTKYPLIILLFCSTAYAVPSQNLNPALGGNDYLVTQDAKVTLPSMKLMWHFEKDPLVINKKPGNERITEVIEARNNLFLSAAVSIENFQFGIGLPVVLGQQWGGEQLQNGVGDLRLGVKINLLSHEFVNLAASVDVTAPIATADHYGESDGSFSPKLIASNSFGIVDLAVNIGFRLRSDETIKERGYQELGVGQLFTASGAVRVKFLPDVSFVSDFFMSATLSSVTQEEVPTEWANLLVFNLPHGFNPFLGSSVSFTRGVGSPQPRIFAGLTWVWEKEECPQCKTPEPVIITETIIKERRPLVVVKKDTITIKTIYFDTDKATLRQESKNILDEIVDTLQKKPCIKKIRVEGYCDHRASRTYNIELSKRRVQSAIDYLKNKGVTVKLEQRYYGEDHRVDASGTEDGMQLNRRVEFHITGIKKCK